MGHQPRGPVLPNPFCPFTAARILSLKATVWLLLGLLIKARIRIAAFSALGLLLLMLQTLLILAVGGGLAVTGAGAMLYASRRKQTAAA